MKRRSAFGAITDSCWLDNIAGIPGHWSKIDRYNNNKNLNDPQSCTCDCGILVPHIFFLLALVAIKSFQGEKA
jgi:hypothetical protein